MNLSAMALLALMAPLQTTGQIHLPERRPFWSGHPTAASFAESVDRRLARGAAAARSAPRGVRRKRTVANTLEPYDDLQRDLDDAANEAQLIAAVHPDSAMRAAAEAAASRASALSTAIALDRGVYQALAGMDLTGADPATRYYAERTLLAFRLAGVDKDDATRERIRALREELEKLSQAFGRNIRDDVRNGQRRIGRRARRPPRRLHRRPPARGRRTHHHHHRLPRRAPGVHLCAERGPAEAAADRVRQSRLSRRTRPSSTRMIARRDELAHLVGYRSWADYITADKMVGPRRTPRRSSIASSPRPTRPLEADYERLLRRKRQDDPSATTVMRWESGYYRELVRRSRLRVRFPAGPAVFPL